MQYHKDHKQTHWNVAYLPIDPRDIGRRYEAVVRINSQSGKGGVALVLERDFNIELPKWMHAHLSRLVQADVEKTGEEISPHGIKELYDTHFVSVSDDWKLRNYHLNHHEQQVSAQFSVGNSELKGQGAGALEALSGALKKSYNCELGIVQFDQHALGAGSDANAQACVEVRVNNEILCATAIAGDTSAAALQALLTAFSHSRASTAQGVA